MLQVLIFAHYLKINYIRYYNFSIKMSGLRNLLFILFIVCLGSSAIAQTNEYSVSGFIKDAVTGEILIGANILLYRDSLSARSQYFRGTTSNNYGFYVLPKLQAGNYYLIVRYLGYKNNVKEISHLTETRSHFNIDLSPEFIKKEEIIVTGKKNDRTLISTIDISPELLSKLPSLSGEADLFKLLELLPGVKSESELSSGLYIRGGSPDQNLTLVDGMTEYNPAHIGNIASTFNSDAVQDIRLIKGAFPAEYGGRLSSILDIKLRSGTKEKNIGTIGLGLINSFFSLEGPVGSKSTYMIAGRGMYYDSYQKQFNKNSVIPRYNFYDLKSKINYSIIIISFEISPAVTFG